MNTWAIIYEYCDTHDNCRNPGCRKTVVVQARIQIPEINLLKTLLPPANTVRFVKKHSLSGFCLRTILHRTEKRVATHIQRPKTLTFRMPVPLAQFAGITLLALGLGGIVGPLIPQIRMEAQFAMARLQESRINKQEGQKPLPKSAPVVFEPLKGPDGLIITPVSETFSLIIPKIGVNSPVVSNVDPADANAYTKALVNGVAHAATSFFPDQNGTVYIFSHSTNYEWFVKDLNAVFYLVKNLEKGDNVVLIYNSKRYTYRIADKKIVAPSDTKFLIPFAGKKSLILETCWPPGSVSERLLIFADLVEANSNTI